MPRFFCATPLVTGTLLELPEGAARHVQVLRLQPGHTITLFDGLADTTGLYGEFAATVTHMGRSNVAVQVGVRVATQREPAHTAHLVLGMPANERMDWLVEKAAELGAASIQPLMTERSVLRLAGERAVKKQSHWQSVAVAACEQCGGNRVPVVHAVLPLAQWLAASDAPNQPPAAGSHRALLSLRKGAQPLHSAVLAHNAVTFLSGPEGGLSAAEEDAAMAHGFVPMCLGARVLRAETAALAALIQCLS